jgi:hypothetical protein
MEARPFLIFYWVVTGLFATAVIGWTVLKAIRSKPEELLMWRRIKVISSALGLVGFVMLVLGFETVVRSTIVEDAQREATLLFVGIKTEIRYHMAIACANVGLRESEEVCSDFHKFDQFTPFHKLIGGEPFGRIVDWHRDPRIDTEVAGRNDYLARIDKLRELYVIPSTFSFYTRVNISLLSALLVCVAIAGALGESIFQFMQARAQERKQGAKQS